MWYNQLELVVFESDGNLFSKQGVITKKGTNAFDIKGFVQKEAVQASA